MGVNGFVYSVQVFVLCCDAAVCRVSWKYIVFWHLPTDQGGVPQCGLYNVKF